MAPAIAVRTGARARGTTRAPGARSVRAGVPVRAASGRGTASASGWGWRAPWRGLRGQLVLGDLADLQAPALDKRLGLGLCEAQRIGHVRAGHELEVDLEHLDIDVRGDLGRLFGDLQRDGLAALRVELAGDEAVGGLGECLLEPRLVLDIVVHDPPAELLDRRGGECGLL